MGVMHHYPAAARTRKCRLTCKASCDRGACTVAGGASRRQRNPAAAARPRRRGDRMKRREFIRLLGGAAAWPLAARAQQRAVPVVGLLWVASERVVKPYEEAIRAGLRELGWGDGDNFRLEVRYGNGEASRLPGLIDELIALNPTVLSGISEVVALMKAKHRDRRAAVANQADPRNCALYGGQCHRHHGTRDPQPTLQRAWSTDRCRKSRRRRRNDWDRSCGQGRPRRLHNSGAVVGTHHRPSHLPEPHP